MIKRGAASKTISEKLSQLPIVHGLAIALEPMTMLIYKSHALIGDLAVGECTMHRASGSSRGRWWQLWFRVLRETDGQPEDFCVPMNPGGGYIENGPGGKTWGLTVPIATPYDIAPGTKNWQVSPSINVLNTGDAYDGQHLELPSLWHQTPEIVGVPDDEPWANGVAP